MDSSPDQSTLDYATPSANVRRAWVMPHDIAGMVVFLVCLVGSAVLAVMPTDREYEWIIVGLGVGAFLRWTARRLCGATMQDQRDATEKGFWVIVALMTIVILLNTMVHVRCSHGWSAGLFRVGITHSNAASPCNLPYARDLDYQPVGGDWVVWSAW